MRYALSAAIAAGLLALASGCTKQQAANPLAPKTNQLSQLSQLKSQPAQSTTLPQTMTKVQKAPEGPKRPPKVESCLLAGQSFLEAAETTEDPTLRAQRFLQARKAFQQALGLDPSNRKAMFGLARVCDKEGDYATAEAGYREILKAAPNDAQVWYELGMCQARQRNWDQAVEALQRANQLSRSNPTYSSHLGWALARSGQYDAALAHFRRTVGLAKANYNLALMMDHLGYSDVCRRYLIAALNADPNLEEARSLLESLQPVSTPRPANAHLNRSPEAEGEIVPVDFRAAPAPKKSRAGKPGAARPGQARPETEPEAGPTEPVEPMELQLGDELGDKLGDEAPLPVDESPVPHTTPSNPM